MAMSQCLTVVVTGDSGRSVIRLVNIEILDARRCANFGLSQEKMKSERKKKTATAQQRQCNKSEDTTTKAKKLWTNSLACERKQ